MMMIDDSTCAACMLMELIEIIEIDEENGGENETCPFLCPEKVFSTTPQRILGMQAIS